MRARQQLSTCGEIDRRSNGKDRQLCWQRYPMTCCSTFVSAMIEGIETSSAVNRACHQAVIGDN